MSKPNKPNKTNRVWDEVNEMSQTIKVSNKVTNWKGIQLKSIQWISHSVRTVIRDFTSKLLIYSKQRNMLGDVLIAFVFEFVWKAFCHRSAFSRRWITAGCPAVARPLLKLSNSQYSTILIATCQQVCSKCQCECTSTGGPLPSAQSWTTQEANYHPKCNGRVCQTVKVEKFTRSHLRALSKLSNLKLPNPN